MSEATWQEVDWEMAEVDDEEECTESVPPLVACAGAFSAASGAFTADSTAAGAFTAASGALEHYTNIRRIQYLASQHPLVAAVSSLTATASGAPSASAASDAPSSAPAPQRPSAPALQHPRPLSLARLLHLHPRARLPGLKKHLESRAAFARTSSPMGVTART